MITVVGRFTAYMLLDSDNKIDIYTQKGGMFLSEERLVENCWVFRADNCCTYVFS